MSPTSILLAASLAISCHPSSDHLAASKSSGEPETLAVHDDRQSGSGPPEFIERHGIFEGTVEEALPAGSYTYFSVRLDSGEHRWAVVLGGKQQRDEIRLRFESFGVRHNFKSPRLDREFDEIYFCSLSPPAEVVHTRLPVP